MNRVVVVAALLAAGTSCATRHMPAPPRSLFQPGARPLDVRQGDIESHDGYSRIAVTYASSVGRVPADLYLPASGARARVPAIIFLHGLPGQKETMAPLAIAYAKAGVAGLTISAPFNRDDIPYRQGDVRLLPAPLFNEHDREEFIQSVADVRRAIDVLARDPRIDARRIAFVDFSYGGMVGAVLAAVEARFRAVALMSPSAGLATWMRADGQNGIARLSFRAMPDEMQNQWLASMDEVDAWRFIAAYPPGSPVLIQFGRNDFQVPKEDRDLLIRSAARHARVLWYDSGHELPVDAERDQAAFFSKRLGLALDRFRPPVR